MTQAAAHKHNDVSLDDISNVVVVVVVVVVVLRFFNVISRLLQVFVVVSLSRDGNVPEGLRVMAWQCAGGH